jgi:hypothetical protein
MPHASLGAEPRESIWVLHPVANFVLCRIRVLGVPCCCTESAGWVWVLGVTAIVNNPILRVHLTREIWSVVNVATIVIALWSIAVLKRETESKNEMPNKPDAGDGL